MKKKPSSVSRLLYVHVHLWGLFPLITFVVNMMYLQFIYQREALQMPEIVKQIVLQLACRQVIYGFINISHIGIYHKYFPYRYLS